MHDRLHYVIVCGEMTLTHTLTHISVWMIIHIVHLNCQITNSKLKIMT